MAPVPFYKQILVVLLGGGIGSLVRFLISYKVQSMVNSIFPFGILSINLIGCLLIGILAGLLFEHYALGGIWRAGILIGFLGGFTTFSSFSLDTLTLLENGEYFYAVLYLFVSVGGGILATFCGLGVIRLAF